MKEQVSNFIKQKKEKHLLSIGLIDEEKSPKIYAPTDWAESVAIEHGYTHKDEKGRFKYKKPIPLDVTDEEYEEICKVCPPVKRENNEILKKIDSIRKMLMFFVVITVISMIIGAILGIIAVS